MSYGESECFIDGFGECGEKKQLIFYDVWPGYGSSGERDDWACSLHGAAGGLVVYVWMQVKQQNFVRFNY